MSFNNNRHKGSQGVSLNNVCSLSSIRRRSIAEKCVIILGAVPRYCCHTSAGVRVNVFFGAVLNCVDNPAHAELGEAFLG